MPSYPPGSVALLGPDEGPAWSCINPSGRSPFLFLGDHAGNKIPRSLGSLGVDPADLARHIGWDIEVAALGTALAKRLDASFLAQRFSRLVIDCNRDPAHREAIPEMSDGSAIPGNRALSLDDRAARVREIHVPYQEKIAERIAARPGAILVALHSFTPVLDGAARPWAVGVLHDGGNDRFARRMLAALEREGDLLVGDNQPYRMDATDHTIPRHAYPAGHPYVELEFRQDLLAADLAGWTGRVARILEACADDIGR